jgi:hypothetical protein
LPCALCLLLSALQIRDPPRMFETTRPGPPCPGRVILVGVSRVDERWRMDGGERPLRGGPGRSRPAPPRPLAGDSRGPMSRRDVGEPTRRGRRTTPPRRDDRTRIDGLVPPGSGSPSFFSNGSRDAGGAAGSVSRILGRREREEIAKNLPWSGRAWASRAAMRPSPIEGQNTKPAPRRQPFPAHNPRHPLPGRLGRECLGFPPSRHVRGRKQSLALRNPEWRTKANERWSKKSAARADEHTRGRALGCFVLGISRMPGSETLPP